MCDFRQTHPDFGVLALKSYYRGCKYATEMIKILPQKPNDILVAQLFRKIATLGGIHVAKSPFIRQNWRRYGLPLLALLTYRLLQGLICLLITYYPKVNQYRGYLCTGSAHQGSRYGFITVGFITVDQ